MGIKEIRKVAYKYGKKSRTLDIYVRLGEGMAINKAEEAIKFGVDERSIQRDIDDIRAFLMERAVTDDLGPREIVYSRTRRGFVMTGAESLHMSNSEILAVSKILLESRAFTKSEIDLILYKMIAGCVPRENMKLVGDLLSNEKYHYVELHNKSRSLDKLWEIGTEIKQCNLLEILYQKQTASLETVKRIIQPVALLFSEYYFYLHAYIVERNEKQEYIRKYDYPAVFRIDRIKKYHEIGKKFAVVYASRFEEGEFRKRVQFMYAGKLVKIQFRYMGNNVEAILDRLPTAIILCEEPDGYIIEAEVYGRGILMWLLSQGSMVEVLQPKDMREDMKRTLLEMLGKYD